MAIYFRSTPENEPFVFDSIGNHWEQERVIRPKGYPVYHYLQTERGIGRIEIQGKSYSLKEGEGVLIAPFISHSYAAAEEGWTTLFVTIAGRIESSIPSILDNKKVIFTGKEQGEKMEAFVSEVLEKCENPAINTKELSIDCYRFIMNFTDGVYGKEMVNDPLYQRYVAPIVEEIETNYSTRLTVAGLCQKVYITPQYLSRLFQRFLGCSAYEYLTTYRITKAKEMLLVSPKMEVQHIAQQVGFEDASHFIAMFKKMTEVTPLEFRALYKFHI